MTQFDRYVLSQLMVMFGLSSLVLVLIYWINRAVVLFDRLIADGQSALVFLEFTALTLPTMIRITLPLAAFAASVYVTHRMTQESELVVMQSTGFSPYRLARPVLYFGVIVFALMSILTHLLVPLATAQLNQRERELAQDVSARLLSPGAFIEPTDGVTFYVADVTPAGELQNVFLTDLRNPAREVTYTASLAYMINTDGMVQLVMRNGLAQVFDAQSNQLTTTSFEDFAFNISDIMAPRTNTGRRSAEVPTPELLRASPALAAETGQRPARLIARAHDRISKSLLGSIAAMLGFAALIVGGYSRFGVWRQVVFAIFLIIVIKAAETIGEDIARQDPALWYASYLAVISGVFIVLGLMKLAATPALRSFRIRRAI